MKPYRGMLVSSNHLTCIVVLQLSEGVEAFKKLVAELTSKMIEVRLLPTGQASRAFFPPQTVALFHLLTLCCTVRRTVTLGPVCVRSNHQRCFGCLQVVVDPELIGVLIGKKGATITKLRQDTGEKKLNQTHIR